MQLYAKSSSSGRLEARIKLRRPENAPTRLPLSVGIARTPLRTEAVDSRWRDSTEAHRRELGLICCFGPKHI